jgi:hypothetical protein
MISKNTSHQLYEVLKKHIELPEPATAISLVLDLASPLPASVTVTYYVKENGILKFDRFNMPITKTKTTTLEELLNGN